MRNARRVLLALPAAGLAVVALAASAAGTPPPGSDYAWAQPERLVADVPCAQPPAEIPIVACVQAPIPDRDYVWAQPGAALPDVPNAAAAGVRFPRKREGSRRGRGTRPLRRSATVTA